MNGMFCPRRTCILMIDYDAAHLNFSRFNFSCIEKKNTNLKEGKAK